MIVTAAAAAEYLAKFQALRDPSELRRAIGFRENAHACQGLSLLS